MQTRVLLVDDEPAVREIVSYMLADTGDYCVTAVGDERAAVDSVASSGVPDVVIMDHVLRGITGFQVYDTLVARAGRTIPAMLLTGSADDLSAQAARRGMVIVYKPIRINDLRAVIDDLLVMQPCCPPAALPGVSKAY
jgi:CheY-like chemotaxis protein